MQRKLPAIIIDTREQTPLEFVGLQTIKATLKTGDYSIQGYENLVAVERKSKEDAYQCVGASRKRFKDCLTRLGKLDRAAIVIECSLSDFRKPPPRTKIDERMAEHSYISWACRHNVHVFWAGSRLDAERIIIRFFGAYVVYAETKREEAQQGAHDSNGVDEQDKGLN